MAIDSAEKFKAGRPGRATATMLCIPGIILMIINLLLMVFFGFLILILILHIAAPENFVREIWRNLVATLVTNANLYRTFYHLPTIFPSRDLPITAVAAVLGALFAEFYTSLTGFIGAYRRSKLCLLQHTILVFILCGAEIFGVMYGLNVAEVIEKDPENLVAHWIRISFNCCSVYHLKPPPWSCCGPEGYPDKCDPSIKSDFHGYTFLAECWRLIPDFSDIYLNTILIPIFSLRCVLFVCSILAQCVKSCRASKQS